MSHDLDSIIDHLELDVCEKVVQDEPTRNMFDDYARGFNAARTELLGVLRNYSSLLKDKPKPVHAHKACWRRIDEYKGGAMCCECVPHEKGGCNYAPREMTGHAPTENEYIYG